MPVRTRKERSLATAKPGIMRRTVTATGAVLTTAVAVAACGGQRVADPFASGVTGGKVVANMVICEPTPKICGRYVVIDPLPGTSQADLIATAEAVVRKELGWRRSANAPEPRTQGVAFDGPTAAEGGYVNTAAAELDLDTGDLDTSASASTGRQVLGAMRAHPSAVVVRIINAP
jgi:hypothetical protein